MTSKELDNLNPGTVVSVRTGNLASGGAFIGPIVDGPQALLQKKAFIRFAGPEELVRARIVQNSARFAEAELLEVLEPSTARRNAPCEVFGVCGGCDLQHLHVETQREAKRVMVEQTLRRHLKRPELNVQDCSANLPEFHYRARISLHVDDLGNVGFFRRGTSEVVVFRECWLVSKSISAALTTLREPLRAHAASLGALVIEDRHGQLELLLRLRPGASLGAGSALDQLIAAFEPLVSVLSISRNATLLYHSAANDETSIALAEDQAEGELLTGHFTQVNAEANEILRREVVARISHSEVLELYAGAGNFSLPLAAQGKHVIAVELDPALVRVGQREAQRSGLEAKIEFVESHCERFLRQYQRSSFPQSVLLDPPRSGAPHVVGALAQHAPQQIVYVSCNLPTLTRDLQTLLGESYQLQEVLMLDMFPQTHHAEVVAVLFRG